MSEVPTRRALIPVPYGAAPVCEDTLRDQPASKRRGPAKRASEWKSPWLQSLFRINRNRHAGSIARLFSLVLYVQKTIGRTLNADDVEIPRLTPRKHTGHDQLVARLQR